jgi:hypothetical protein
MLAHKVTATVGEHSFPPHVQVVADAGLNRIQQNLFCVIKVS